MFTFFIIKFTWHFNHCFLSLSPSQFWSQPYRTGIRKLKHDLNLPLEGDFRIVLAAAEKLKPGLCHLLYSDRWQEADYIGNSTEV